MPSGVEPGLDPLEVGGGPVGEVLGGLGRRPTTACRGRPLRVEDPQRVVVDLLAVLVGDVAQVLPEEGLEHAGVADPVLGLTHGVEQQVDPPQADLGQEVPGQGDDLDVDVGVVDPEDLDAELPVLAVPAGLGALVAERGRDVPDLPGVGRVVLDVGPHHRGRALGAQGDAPAALVLEVVHLLA